MNLSSEYLFFFSALGAFNGVVMSIYILFVEGKKHIGNTFLGIALLMLSVRAGKSVFFYFNHNLIEFFIQLGIIACFFIGPFLYFYIHTVCDEDWEPPNWKIHLLVLTPVILVPTFIFPYFEYKELWAGYFMWLIYLQWLAYILLSFLSLNRVVRKLLRNKANLNPAIKWTIQVLGGFTLVWVAYFTGGYTSYIVGALTFTVIFYLLILFLVNTKKNQVFLLRKNTIPIRDAEKFDALLKDMDDLFRQEEIYRQPTLKSADVARLLGIPNYIFSQILNDHIGKNFNAYINTYRIEAAKKMLRQNPELTIEAIGIECGFKSKSSFYAAFKKETGITPAKYV